jgi:hypothetical protein
LVLLQKVWGRRLAEYLLTHHIVRVAYLAGRGCSLEEIMEDIEFVNRGTVQSAMQQYAIELDGRPAGSRVVPVIVGPKAMQVLRKAAGKRDIIGADRARKVAQRLIETFGNDPGMVDSILDDGIKTGEAA